MTYRVLRYCEWCPDGVSHVQFGPGEMLTARDPRVAGGFFHTALRQGWVEEVTHAVQDTESAAPPVKRARAAPRAKRQTRGRKGSRASRNAKAVG